MAGVARGSQPSGKREEGIFVGPLSAGHLLTLRSLSSPSRQQYAQCALQQKVATGDLTQQQLTTFLQQLQALKPR